MNLVNWPVNQQSIVMLDVFDEQGNLVLGSATFEKNETWTYLGIEGIPTIKSAYCVRAGDIIMPKSEIGFGDTGEESFKTWVTEHAQLGKVIVIKIDKIRLRTKFSIMQESATVAGADGQPSTTVMSSLLVPNFSSGIELAPIWTTPDSCDYEYWLIAKYPQEHSRIYFIATKKSNRSHIGRPPLPNCYPEGRLCAGNEHWGQGESDPMQVGSLAIKAFYNNSWNTDLMEQRESTTKKVFRFNMDESQAVSQLKFTEDCHNIQSPMLSTIMMNVQ